MNNHKNKIPTSKSLRTLHLTYGHCHEQFESFWLKLEWHGRGSWGRRTGCRRSTRAPCCAALSGCPASDSATCWGGSPAPVTQAHVVVLLGWKYIAIQTQPREDIGLTFCGLTGTLSKFMFMPGMITVIFRGPLNPSTLVSCQMVQRVWQFRLA